MSDILKITSNDIPFTVRIVHKGDAYGLAHALTYDKDEPSVEFYDGRYDTDQFEKGFGQFITRYYARTLLRQDHKPGKGLMLDTGSPDWRIEGETMAIINAWMRQRVDTGAFA